MFRFLAKRAYKKQTAEELIRQLAEVRASTITALKGVSGPSQLNKLAEQLIHEHWDWCRVTEDPLGESLTLTAFGEAVARETVALGLHMPSVDIGHVYAVNSDIWELLEERGVVDTAKIDSDMPERLQQRIDAIREFIQSSAKELIEK